MKINPNNIAPSQDFLKPQTIKFIFECINLANEDKLPPTPIVRKDSTGGYVAIDGHNLIAVKAFLGQDIDVHVASSKLEGLPEVSKENRQRNNDLREKFEICLIERDRVAGEGIVTFSDLIVKNKDLFEV